MSTNLKTKEHNQQITFTQFLVSSFKGWWNEGDIPNLARSLINTILDDPAMLTGSVLVGMGVLMWICQTI